jgi:hypothetical protein
MKCLQVLSQGLFGKSDDGRDLAVNHLGGDEVAVLDAIAAGLIQRGAGLNVFLDLHIGHLLDEEVSDRDLMAEFIAALIDDVGSDDLMDVSGEKLKHMESIRFVFGLAKLLILITDHRIGRDDDIIGMVFADSQAFSLGFLKAKRMDVVVLDGPFIEGGGDGLERDVA